MTNLHISLGLPGSGKTTLFAKLANSNRTANHIECDHYLNGRTRYKNMEELLSDRSSLFYDETYLDGLFLKKSDIKKIIDIAKARGRYPKSIIVHYWHPNVDACKWNDRGRREKDSSITIDNADIDSIEEIKKIKDDFNDIKFQFKLYSVERKPAWRIFADENELYIEDETIVYGDSWSLGGSWADCWGNKGSVSPGEAPSGFRELDELLERVAPGITFLQYKNIMNNCAGVEDYTSGDYYGGTTYHKKQKFNVECLYNYLVDKNLIQSIE